MQNGILSETINNAIIQIGDIDDTGKGRHFVSRFIKDGLVKIEGHGIVLLKKETLDASLPSMVGTPVIIQHQNVTKSNANKLRIGTISNAYFNEPDGWYYCEGIIWDDEAKDLIDKGWSVSCSYDFLAYNDEGGVENNIKYDKEFTKLNFTHLAIVDNPRYERANIVFNCKVDNDRWITIKPHGDESDDYRRLKLEDGETPKEAIDRVYKKGDKKQSDTKDSEDEGFEKETKSTKKDEDRHQKVRDLEDKAYKEFKTLYDNYIHDNDMEGWGHFTGSRFSKATEKFNKKYKDAFNKLKSDRFVSFEDFAKRENEQSDTKEESKKSKIDFSEYSDAELEHAIDVYKSNLSTAMEYGDAQYNAEKDMLSEIEKELGRRKAQSDTKDKQSDSKGDLDIKKTTVKMKSGKTKEIEYVDSVPEGYKKLEGAMTAPLGYTWYHNGKSIIDKERKTILVKDKVNNNKEQDMALLEEIKKLITKVENNKENDEMIDNEKVDKRKLIDEVAGIMKSAGCDDEDIRTAIGKMEKIGYDKSEDGSADNKKVKNEEPEKKDDVDDKKVDNEDAEDEKKVDELKKEEKEDVDNKCKNSKSSFDKINEIYNSIKQVSEEKTYVSRQEKLDNAVEYFK